MPNTRVAIAIQARSTSQRLPAKVNMKIGEEPLISHVIRPCLVAANKLSKRDGLDVQVYVLTPERDPVAKHVRRPVRVIEGPEHDVLTRYMLLVQREVPDYVVRVTGDCPLLPEFVLLSHITHTVKDKMDYVTNTLEESRTALDGWDCEVMSLRLMHWLHQNAVEDPDREHVTSLIRRHRPPWALIGHVINYVDLSHMKLSVDTEAELAQVRQQHASLHTKVAAAKAKGDRVYRL